MPPTPTPNHNQRPPASSPSSSDGNSRPASAFDATRVLIRLSTTPLLSLERYKLKHHARRRAVFSSLASSRMIRQILIVLGLGSILLTCLFLYNNASPKSKLLFSGDSDDVASYFGQLDDGPLPVVFQWHDVEKLFNRFACDQFNPPPTPEPGQPPPSQPKMPLCQAPLEPFDTAAFQHRPSGTELLNFSRILLLVLFNHPHAETIPFVEMLYRPHFPNIVYCLPEAANNAEKLAKSGRKNRNDDGKTELPVFDRVSHNFPLFRILNSTFFMDVDIVTYPQPFMNRMAGENNYACFVEVSRRLLLAKQGNSENPETSKRDRLKASDFDGILVSADDLLVHIWNLAKPGYDPTKPWVMDRPIRVYDVNIEKECAVDEPPQEFAPASTSVLEQTVAERCELDVDWQWFRLYAVEMGEFSNEMERYALESRLFGECHHRLRESLGGSSRRFLGNGGSGDFYYIPNSLLMQAHDVMALMAAHNVFVEIAVPTALRCLVKNSSTDIVHVQGEGMNWAYARSRDRPWSAYSAASSLLLPYYHPLKVAELLMPPPRTQTPSAAAKQLDLSCFVCKTILPKFRWFRQYVANNFTPPVELPPWL